MGILSPRLFFCQLQTLQSCFLSRRWSDIRDNLQLDPSNPSCYLPTRTPYSNIPISASSSSPPIGPLSCLWRRAVSAPYQLAERPIGKGECIFVLASSDFFFPCVCGFFFPPKLTITIFLFFFFPIWMVPLMQWERKKKKSQSPLKYNNKITQGSECWGGFKESSFPFSLSL